MLESSLTPTPMKNWQMGLWRCKTVASISQQLGLSPTSVKCIPTSSATITRSRLVLLFGGG